MLPPLSITFNLTGAGLSLSKFCETISACQLSERVKTLAISCFKGGTCAYLCLFGNLELYQNIIAKKTEEIQNSTLCKVTSLSKAYFNVHGGLLLGCGLLSLADLLHEFGVLNLGPIENIVNVGTNVLFLCASILALKENIRVLYELKNLDKTAANLDEKELHWIGQSAFFGLISNVGYIIATASLIFNGATTFTILAAIFSCFFGGIKVIYDIFTWAKEKNYF